MKKYIFITISIILICGCMTLESTTRFYLPVSSELFEAKPPGVMLPILHPGKTKRAYKVIGLMEFESGASESFILNAVQYNGQIHGADAIILNEWEKEKNSYVTWYPGRVTLSYDHYACDTGVFWTDYYSRPYYETQTYITHKVKAEMIVFLDKETFGYLGFLFEDTRNTNYLEIGRILQDSPAMRAGFKKGYRIKKIDDYECNKGLEHYHKNAPLYKVGQAITIEYIKNGESELTSVIAEKINSN